MKRFKGTPTPWLTREGFIYGSDGSLVGESYGHIEDDYLIAAAPELLEALIECRPWLGLCKELQNKVDLVISKVDLK